MPEVTSRIDDNFRAQVISVTDNAACSPLMKEIIDTLLASHDLIETENVEFAKNNADLTAQYATALKTVETERDAARERVATLEAALAAKADQNPLP